jgi:hypothetical protein
MLCSDEGSSITAGSVKSTLGKLRFRHGSSARYDSDFAKDQPWVKIRGKSKLHDSFNYAHLPSLHSWYPNT